MFETLAVILIIAFIIALGLKFYTSTRMSSLEDTNREITELDAVKTALILTHMPEIACSFQGVIDLGCIDLQQAQAWDAIIKEERNNVDFILYYSGILGQSDIFIEEIYPKSEQWIIYNTTQDGSFDYLRQPVVLHDSLSGKNKLGVLHIKVYY